MSSAAIIIKGERSKDKKYSFYDFVRSREITEPQLEVPSSLSEAVKNLAATDDDLKLVRKLHYAWFIMALAKINNMCQTKN